MNKYLKSFIISILFLCSILFCCSSSTSNEIKTLLDTIEVGKAETFKNLTIVPIYANDKIISEKLYTLDYALNKNWLDIVEVNGGDVPQVKITNKSSNYIYIVGGEIITGCKQDRIVSRDVIVAPKRKELSVPVYCVEHGRWSYNSDKFYSKENIGTYKLRSEAQKNESATQSKIWNEISKNAAENKVSSHTDAYQDIYENDEVAKKIEKYNYNLVDIKKFKDNTVGIAIGIDGKIISLDIFYDNETFKKSWPKLLKASSLSAIMSSDKKEITKKDVENFISNIKNKPVSKKSPIDLGKEYSILDKEINVNALVYNNTVIHIAAFPSEKE